MRTVHCLNALLLLTASIPGLGSAFDVKAGQSLHDAHCMKCHGSEVYTRTDRRITTMDSLRQQVQRCDTNLGLTWFDEEIENVSQYLNATYYKLE
ncbi:MAG: cytochrome c [Gammaproteobacteria bacterium]|nr:cytochrome c [Gammaproteobacteria bacterium]